MVRDGHWVMGGSLVLRKISLLVLASVLLAPACGGDDDDENASKTTTTLSAEDKHYEDVFVLSVVRDLGVTEAEARCAAGQAIGAIGVPRLREAGVTEEMLAAENAPATELTDEEAGEVADALLECADMGDVFLREATADAGFTPEQLQCFADGLSDDLAYREQLVVSLQEGDEADMPRAMATKLVDAQFECLPIADQFIGVLEKDGTQLSDADRQCLRDEFKSDDAFRESLITEMTGGEPMTDEDSVNAIRGMAIACGIG
jgi:hypothetical protein